jgi:hypothetical protein
MPLLLFRQRRRDELVQVQQGISEAFAASLVGQEVRTAGLVQPVVTVSNAQCSSKAVHMPCSTCVIHT